MPIFGILAIISASMFIFYRGKTIFRTLPPYEHQWTRAKGTIAIGLFLTFFAINQFIHLTSKVSLIVNIIFIIFGLANVSFGYKAYRYFTPLAIEEAEKNTKS